MIPPNHPAPPDHDEGCPHEGLPVSQSRTDGGSERDASDRAIWRRRCIGSCKDYLEGSGEPPDECGNCGGPVRPLDEDEYRADGGTSDTERLRVYVAGPYKGGGTWGQNLNAAINAGDRILAAGHVPFIPHTHTALWDLVHPKGSEQWLDIDFEWLAACDALVRLPGRSNGADAEVEYAIDHHIPVYYGVDEFLGRDSENEAVRPREAEP